MKTRVRFFKCRHNLELIDDRLSARRKCDHRIVLFLEHCLSNSRVELEVSVQFDIDHVLRVGDLLPDSFADYFIVAAVFTLNCCGDSITLNYLF